LHTFAEELVVPAQHLGAQPDLGRVAIRSDERVTFTVQLLAFLFGNTVRLPPGNEIQFALLFPVGQVALVDVHLRVVVEEKRQRVHESKIASPHGSVMQKLNVTDRMLVRRCDPQARCLLGW
jgi:hypothetical protein